MVLASCNGRGTGVEFPALVPIVDVRPSVTVAREPPCIEHRVLVSKLHVFLSCLILLNLCEVANCYDLYCIVEKMQV